MKRSLSILYLGHKYGTSRHRADALQRIGHNVEVLDPWALLSRGKAVKKILSKLIYEVGAACLEPYVRHQVLKYLKGRSFDIIWNNQCELIGPTTAIALRRYCDAMVTYANDDPFGSRDKRRFWLYRHSVKHYDLMAVVREPNVMEARALGVHNVIKVPFTADEVAHRHLAITPEERERWASEVIFVGTWMSERGPFLARLMELGVPLTIYGNRWHKAREWPVLKKGWRGLSLDGEEYVMAIQMAKVCLGLLSKGNRDLHARRSSEIPYIGSLLCAERTVEHLSMYREDEEAIFWSTPEECAEKCFALLADEKRRQQIALAGRERCIRSGYLNEPIMERILDTLLRSPSAHGPKFRAHKMNIA